MEENGDYCAKTEIGYIVEEFVRKERIRIKGIPYRLKLAYFEKEAREEKRKQRVEAWRNG